MNRRLRAVVPAGAKQYDAWKWLSTGLPILFVWGLYTLLTSTDIVVLKQFRSAEEVAHYYAAAKIVALVSIVYFAVAATSAHRFTAYHVAGDRAGLARFAATTVRWVFWLSLAFSLLLLALGRPLLTPVRRRTSLPAIRSWPFSPSASWRAPRSGRPSGC